MSTCAGGHSGNGSHGMATTTIVLVLFILLVIVLRAG
ncbi:sporulation protein YjcZ [Cohnella soli]|uniref:Sporulation protein YjcZ n=1 Tax=Cohnella soli TaxID=425005 RepID=A0ABW0I2V2_9BACL